MMLRLAGGMESVHERAGSKISDRQSRKRSPNEIELAQYDIAV